MISVRDRTDGHLKREYECTPDRNIELCFANIECLLEIALLDSDEHIRQLGGEHGLLDLMNGYVNLAYRLLNWKNVQYGENEVKE